MKNLTGLTFGRLKVTGFNRKEKYKFYWNCSCSCGREKIVDGSKLKSGHTRSCGCLKKDSSKGRIKRDIKIIKKESIGKIYGKLKIIDIFRKNGVIRAKCQCSCGNESESVLSNIIAGHTRSCGCNRGASLIKYAKENAGEKNKSWKGGIKKDGGGYLREYCPGHPNAYKNYVSQHRLVMEGMLGRYLRPEESVHHKNGIRNDNRPANLELWVKSHPQGQRVADLVAWCVEQIKRYQPEILSKEKNY